MDERAAAAELMRMVNGYQLSQAICVAAMLGIADHLKGGPRSGIELATATKANPQALYRLLRALASVDVFHEDEERVFSLTTLGAALVSDAPFPVSPWALLAGRPYYRAAWGDLLHSVKTGENAFEHGHGMNVWEYRADHPEESLIFDRAMTANSRAVAAAVTPAYDFQPFDVIMDIGGGQGALLAAILERNPRQRGILFDQPQVVANAGPTLESAGVADRCDIVSGDFFTAVPEGADAQLLKWILHDWDDEKCLAILKNCRRAIRPHGKLFVLESVLAPPNEGALAKFADLNMLVVPGGEERTEEQFSALLAAADFQLERIIPAGPRTSILEARPI